MTLRRRLYVAASLLLVLVILGGVLLVISVEATVINQADQQLTSEYANPVIRASIQGGVPPKFSLLPVGEFYVAELSGGERYSVAKPLELANQSPKTPSVASAANGLPLQFVEV
jgi:hypothetical protein